MLLPSVPCPTGQAGPVPPVPTFYFVPANERVTRPRRLQGEPTLFRAPASDETKLARDKTISVGGEDLRKLALGTNRPTKRGREGSMTGDRHDQGTFCHRRCHLRCRRTHRSARLFPPG